MKSILREQRRSSIVAAAVTILLGLMLVLVPNRSIRFLCGLLGTALMVTGLIYIWVGSPSGGTGSLCGF